MNKLKKIEQLFYHCCMRLIVDGVSSSEYPDKLTIADLLKKMDVEPVPWLIISVNDQFYRKDQIESISLNDGDQVDLIYVRGGG